MFKENKNNFDISKKAKMPAKANLQKKRTIKNSSVAVSDEIRKKINALAYLERVSARQMADDLLEKATQDWLDSRGSEYTESYREELERQS